MPERTRKITRWSLITKVAMAAVKDDYAVAELAKRFDPPPNTMVQWGTHHLLENTLAAFDGGNPVTEYAEFYTSARQRHRLAFPAIAGILRGVPSSIRGSGNREKSSSAST